MMLVKSNPQSDSRSGLQVSLLGLLDAMGPDTAPLQQAGMVMMLMGKLHPEPAWQWGLQVPLLGRSRLPDATGQLLMHGQ